MKTNTNYDMYIPTRLIFGEGMLNKLNEQPMPGKKALLIISIIIRGSVNTSSREIDETVYIFEIVIDHFH